MDRVKFSYVLFFISIFLLLATRPRLDIGFILNPAYIIVFLSLFSFLFLNGIKIYRHEIVLMVFYGWCCITLVYSYDAFIGFRFVAGVGLFFVLFLVIKSFSSKLPPILFYAGFSRVGKIYFIVSFILYAIAVLNFKNLSEHDLYAGVYIERGFLRMTSLGYDPNIFAISLMPFLFFFLEKMKRKWFFLGLVLLVLSFSRGGWAAFFVGLVVFFIMKNRKDRVNLLPFIILNGMAGILYYYNLFHFGDLINSRLHDITSGSGRLEIWQHALDLFMERPLFGWGVFTFRSMNRTIWGNDRFAHNTYAEILVETGLVGFSVFLIFLASVFFRLRSAYKDYGFLIPSYFSFLVGMFFLSLYINTIFLFFNVLYGLNCKKRVVVNNE